MRTTVEGTELWGLDEVADSDLRDIDTFRITVGMARQLKKNFDKLKQDVHHLKLANEFLRDQVKEDNRFIAYA